MSTQEALIGVGVILFIGLALLFISLSVAARIMNKEISVRSIFKDFSQKIWMTGGLGIFFFSLFFFTIYFLSKIQDPGQRLHLFFFVHKNPTLFIYGGLLLFASLSVGIYIARIAIKYFYNKKY